MDLKVATEQDIKTELERREMLKRDASIKNHVEIICIAYNTGRIAEIVMTEQFRGTSAHRVTYHVHMKTE